MATTNHYQWNNDDSYGFTAQEVGYELRDPEPGAITLNTGGANSDEMIRIDKDGFYVRGVRVPADDREAETVYLAFKQWLAWANLQR